MVKLMSQKSQLMSEHSQTSRMPQQIWAFFSAFIFVACFLLSSLIPPLQSPDEIDHLERIYLLTKGQLILDTPPDLSSGGMIDSGLARYIEAYGKYRLKTERKLSRDEIDDASSIKWTGTKEFRTASGTGYYFPIIYTPQAIGLAAGEALGLTVDTSYRIARFSVLAVSVLLLLFAFSIHRPPFIAAALLILPMTLFQFASATLDGISTALFILAVSCFARIAIDKKSSKTFLIYVLIACAVLISSSRVHALPIFLLVFASYYYTRNKKALVAGIIALTLVVTWLAMAIKLTTDMRFKDATPTASIIVYYLKDPLAFAKVVYSTLNDQALLKVYFESFVGILGWLDARFSVWVYNTIYAFCLIIFALSLPFRTLKNNFAYRAILIVCGLGSIALVFIALLITWNAIDHPATTIQGIQGRYFLIPVLLIAYALGSEQDIKSPYIRYAGFSALSIFFLFSIYSTSLLLIDRYHLVDEQQKHTVTTLSPSAPLSTSTPTKLYFDKSVTDTPFPLRTISVMFGTYMRTNEGSASLILTTKDGNNFVTDIDLYSLKDNEYKVIAVDGKAYSSGEIRSTTGGGVSVWQSTTQSGEIASCLIYEFTNGSIRFTKGCPRF